MANYYISTAGSDTASGTDTDSSWATIAQVNATAFSAGDNIYFNKGDAWREQLTIPSSGDSDAQITFGAYGAGADPIINASDLITTWTDNSGSVANTWYATCTVEPYQVYFDNTKGTKETAVANLNAANEWFWASNVLYVYSTSDPDTAYTNPGIEASQRRFCIDGANKDYITLGDINTIKAGAINALSYNIYFYNGDYIVINALTTTEGWRGGISLEGVTSNSTIDGVTATYNGAQTYGVGIMIIGGAGTDGNVIKNCSVHDNYGSGICLHGLDATPAGPESGWIQNNQVYNNGRRGISLTTAKNCIIENNTVYSNGQIVASQGEGIKMGSGDQLINYNDNNTVRYNKVYDNVWGMATWREKNFHIYYNLFYANNTYHGIALNHFEGGEVYNNVSYKNNAYCIMLQYGDGANVTIKNNIFKESVTKTAAIYVYANADGFFTSDYNDVHGLTYFGSIAGTVYNFANWKTTTGQDANSITSDPLFVDAANGNFNLQSGSPCRDVGTNVSLTQDYLAQTVPMNGAVDIGALEYLVISPSVLSLSAAQPVPIQIQTSAGGEDVTINVRTLRLSTSMPDDTVSAKKNPYQGMDLGIDMEL